MSPLRDWQDLTTDEFEHVDAERTLALLPVAAIEQHGPHLPLATDALINAGILRRLRATGLRTAKILVLPAQIIGNSLEHTAYPGTLHAPPETLLALWSAIGRSVARSGLRKLVIFNTHGGQQGLVDLVALRLRAEEKLLVVRANYFAFGTPPGLFAVDELAHGLHGGEVETSLMLHLHPEQVRLNALTDFAALPRELAARNRWLGAEQAIGFGWMAQDLHPTGVCGNAAAGDAERGRQLLDYLTEALASLLDETAHLPLSTLRERL
ncbi:MAG: creatininase family protein [Thiotrichales bacterium]